MSHPTTHFPYQRRRLGTVVLPRPRRDGQTPADPDSNTHPASVPAGDWFRQGQETCPVIRTRVTAVQSPTMTG